MELIERAGFLSTLEANFEKIAEGEGHCVLLSGEAGIGKTSLVRAFCKDIKDDFKIFQGTCDALFTPRPLAPLYDIAWQIGTDLLKNGMDTADRAALFANIFQELGNQKEPILLIFEDIHWADEATLDFVKFLARRISRIRCLFILTYRSEEVHSLHPLRHVLGQLPPDSFTRLELPPLSREAVDMLASERGYSGQDVFTISGGNPFYVNEILASYSPGIPDNIKDSILAVFNRQTENTRFLWEILSVIPAGLEIKYLERLEPAYAKSLAICMDGKILVPENGIISFKHELYRRTIEASLSPLVRLSLNKKILDLFLESFEQNQELQRIIHHAKNANEYDLVVRYAPLAAKRAASLGAHLEASKLYFTAIEYYQGHDEDLLISLYEAYAFECYLTNQIKEAIIYQGKLLDIWKKRNDIDKIGHSMRFLSRFWWLEGDREKAEKYATEAIEVLKDQPLSKAKAMVFSNMSLLSMNSGDPEATIFWGEQAVAMARELGDDEILSHALNNVGTAQLKDHVSRKKGIELLQQSLDLALKNRNRGHAGPAYNSLVSAAMKMNDYSFAREKLQEGIQYCEELDLEFCRSYLLFLKARMKMETGDWDDACHIAENLIQNYGHTPVTKVGALVVVGTIRMRRGEAAAIPLLMEAKELAFKIMEVQRIVPALVALLEYEWLMAETVINEKELENGRQMVERLGNNCDINEFAFWLYKARKKSANVKNPYDGYPINDPNIALRAAGLWGQYGRPYEQAITLFECGEEEKRKAIGILQNLGARAVCEKLKLEMRASGIKSIPRGIRKTTQANPAQLTQRELDVLQLLEKGLQNKEIASRLYISAKTVDHHISAILFKLDVNSRSKAVQESIRLGITK